MVAGVVVVVGAVVGGVGIVVLVGVVVAGAVAIVVRVGVAGGVGGRVLGTRSVRMI